MVRQKFRVEPSHKITLSNSSHTVLFCYRQIPKGIRVMFCRYCCVILNFHNKFVDYSETIDLRFILFKIRPNVRDLIPLLGKISVEHGTWLVG